MMSRASSSARSWRNAYVKLTLMNGEDQPHVHVPAQVNRLEDRIDDRYRLTLDNGVVTYQGDTLLIEEPNSLIISRSMCRCRRTGSLV